MNREPPESAVRLSPHHTAVSGWCRLLQRDWVGAFVAFSELADTSRWSKPFYRYLAAGQWGWGERVGRGGVLMPCWRVWGVGITAEIVMW